MITLKREGVAANACTYHKRNRALEGKPSYSNRKEPCLRAHQHSFQQDAEPLGLLTGEQRMSRRRILRGLAGLTRAGGSITSFVTACGLHISPSPASQTSTSSSLSTALYAYRGHSAGVMGVAWSPDGTRLASASNDSTAQVWGAASGGHVYTYRGHVGRVNAVAWSPDGTRLASASNDSTVRVWDAASGGHVYTYRGDVEPVGTVAWAPDGKRLASGSDDGTAQGWDAANGGCVFTSSGRSGLLWWHAGAPP